MKKPIASNAGFPRNTKGFSLVELLIVIVIMTALMTMGAMGIKNLTGGKGSSTAIANAEAIFSEARQIAIGRGTNTRVLIDARDINEQNSYLRRMVIAAQNTDANGNPTESWSMVSRGYTLPEGTFYSRTLSKENATGGDGTTDKPYSFSKQDDTGNYIAYEFNSQGLSVNPGATFILGAGARPKGQEPLVTGSAKRDFQGFTIWSNGETSMFRDPNQIGDLSSIKNF
jgi:prepilin-type N-terminal cleavage/methylation domain-containing protein